MGLRFRRRVRLAPGLRLNLSKRGASVSVGEHGATLNVGRRGKRATVGLPGTGISYSARVGGAPGGESAPQGGVLSGLVGLAVLVAIGWLVYSCAMH